VILDHRGAPVWYKRADTSLIDFKQLANGDLAAIELAFQYGLPDEDVGIRVMSLSGGLIKQVRSDNPTARPIDHHDFVQIDGGWAVINHTIRTGVDLSSIGEGTGQTVVDASIQEIGDDGVPLPGNIDWKSQDHFDPDDTGFVIRFNRLQPPAPGGGEVPLIHMNSLSEIQDGTKDFLASARHLDGVIRIDRTTGAVKWLLGSDATHPQALEIVDDPLDGPLRQHDANLQGDVLTLYDNRTGTAGPARAVAYRIDEVAMTATLLWQIDEPLGRPSPAQGSTRITPDGSILVGWGTSIQPMFEELTQSGERLMAITQQPSAASATANSYRIVKYPASSFDVETLRNTAGGAVQAPGP
jgi:hypothetical protein